MTSTIEKMRTIIPKEEINNAIKRGIDLQIQIGVNINPDHKKIMQFVKESFPKIKTDLYAIGVLQYIANCEYDFKKKLKNISYGYGSNRLFTIFISEELKKIPKVKEIEEEFVF